MWDCWNAVCYRLCGNWNLLGPSSQLTDIGRGGNSSTAVFCVCVCVWESEWVNCMYTVYACVCVCVSECWVWIGLIHGSGWWARPMCVTFLCFFFFSSFFINLPTIRHSLCLTWVHTNEASRLEDTTHSRHTQRHTYFKRKDVSHQWQVWVPFFVFFDLFWMFFLLKKSWYSADFNILIA